MPFVSKAQQRYMNAQRGKAVPADVVDEWNAASKGKVANLPSRINYTRNAHFTAKDVHHQELAEPPEPVFVRASKKKHPGKVQTQPRSYKKGKIGWSTGAKGDDGYMRNAGMKQHAGAVNTKKSNQGGRNVAMGGQAGGRMKIPHHSPSAKQMPKASTHSTMWKEDAAV